VRFSFQLYLAKYKNNGDGLYLWCWIIPATKIHSTDIERPGSDKRSETTVDLDFTNAKQWQICQDLVRRLTPQQIAVVIVRYSIYSLTNPQWALAPRTRYRWRTWSL